MFRCGPHFRGLASRDRHVMTDAKRLMILAITVALISLGGVAQAATFITDSKSELAVVEAKIRAAQFLSRATFGPTKPDIESLATRIQEVGAYGAFEEWIDTQFDETFVVPPTTPVTCPGALEAVMTCHHGLAKQMMLDDGWPAPFLASALSTTNYRHYAWWHAATSAPDQLRQRMAWALAQIFVINDFNSIFNSRVLDDSGEPRYLGVVDYYDMLVGNAFGNYRDTLEDVTRHPVMGIFLSHLGNRKANEAAGTYPDENYGREVEQLFSIGLYEIKSNGDYVLDKNKDPIPSYDNDDIQTFARVFTGLYYAANKLNLHDPMEMRPEWHDTGEKELHNGTVLPALSDSPSAAEADQDISDALDNLFEHPNTGPFIARLLIQRLIKSNPTSRYIDAVAAAFDDNGSGIRGDFKAVIKEILLNKEATESYSFSTKRRPWRLVVNGGGTEHSRLQEPVVRYAAYLRAFGMTSTHPNGYYYIPDRSYWLNQEVYKAPHVFNFYLPNHVPGGELQDYRPRGRIPNRTVYEPEFEIMTAVATNRIANRFRADVRTTYPLTPGAPASDAIRLSVRQCIDCSDPNNPDTETLTFYIPLDFNQEYTDAAADPNGLLENLNILLCHGSLSDTTKDSIAEILTTRAPDTMTNYEIYRAKGAIMSLLTAPDCAVHE